MEINKSLLKHDLDEGILKIPRDNAAHGVTVKLDDYCVAEAAALCEFGYTGITKELVREKLNDIAKIGNDKGVTDIIYLMIFNDIEKVSRYSVIYYMLTDYVSTGGGTNNLQRCRIKISGQRGGHIKMFTSKIDKAEVNARAWAKRNGIFL
jgi:hypothetical protein